MSLLHTLSYSSSVNVKTKILSIYALLQNTACVSLYFLLICVVLREFQLCPQSRACYNWCST